MTYSERYHLVEQAADKAEEMLKEAKLDYRIDLQPNILKLEIDAVWSIDKAELELDVNEPDDIEEAIRFFLEELKEEIDYRLHELSLVEYDPTYDWRKEAANAAGVPLFGPL